MASESAYSEEPVATDKIERWFDLSGGDDTIEPHQSVALIGARAQLQRLVEQRDRLARELANLRGAETREAADRVMKFLDARSMRAGRPYNNPLISSWHGFQLQEPDLRTLIVAIESEPSDG